MLDEEGKLQAESPEDELISPKRRNREFIVGPTWPTFLPEALSMTLLHEVVEKKTFDSKGKLCDVSFQQTELL